MTVYAELVNTFDEEGISDAKSLSKKLKNLPEDDVFSYQYFTDPPRSTHDLGFKICDRLAKVQDKLETLYQSFGIQQFSLNVTPRVEEEDVKKALFLSRMATIFTQHKFRYHSIHFISMNGDETFDLSWSLSNSFIMDLFQFREVIERNELVILPQSIEIKAGWHGAKEIKKNLSLLQQLSNTRVLSSSPESTLIDSIVEKYRRNHQLVILPAIRVPWIRNLDLKAILNLRDDYGDLLDSFQRAYHKLVLEYIENHRSLDFSRISAQINNDIIIPKISKMEKKYKQIITLHRSLGVVGATVSFLPIVGVIIGRTLFNSFLDSDIGSMFPSSISGLVAALSINKIHQYFELKKLEDEDFYIIWQLKKGKSTKL